MNDLRDYSPVQTSQVPANQKLKARVWSIVNSSIFRYSPFFLRSFRVFLLKSFGCKISRGSSISRLARIDFPWNVTIGYLSSIGSNAWIYALDKIEIGDKICVGEEVKLLTGSHDISDRNFRLITKPIKIDNGCWIGTSSTILPGIHIGEGAVIGACSLVTKDVAAWTVVGGNPAKFIKKREIR